MMQQPARTGTPIALTIAGSDSSGGAGIQADLKTFCAMGVYGASVITALTAQNTCGVQGVETVSPSFVGAQLRSVLSDLDVAAIKTGMLANAEIVGTVAQALAAAPRRPLVVDPVMVATSGDTLLAPDAVDAVRASLLPLATLVTPNLPEAAILLRCQRAETEQDMIRQAEGLREATGCHAVLVKGGHAMGEAALDVLASPSGIERFSLPRLDTPHAHGTGCSLSAAIAALLAQGVSLTEAVGGGKSYVWEGLRHGQGLGIGKGRGPIDHLFSIRRPGPPA